MADTLTKQALKGGEFLIRESSSADTFIPEEFNEEQKMMAQMAEDFINNDVLPVNEQLDHQEEDSLIKNSPPLSACVVDVTVIVILF